MTNYFNCTYEEHVKRIEKSMGMSIQEYRQKLDAMITPEYIERAHDYYEYMIAWIDNQKPIYQKYCKKELELKDGEIFYPCFDPVQSGRRELPIFWFYSNYDRLISVQSAPRTKKPFNVIWLCPKEDTEDGRGKQGFLNHVNDQHKTIKHYVLGALVLHRASMLSNALQELNNFGIYSFFTPKDPWSLNGHHEKSQTIFKDLKYDHENVDIIVGGFHQLLRCFRRADEKNEDTTSLENEARQLFSFHGISLPVYIVHGKETYAMLPYKPELEEGDKLLIIN